MNFNYRIKKLNEIIVGWVNYFKLADMKSKLKELDSWIRSDSELVYGKHGN